MSAAKSRWAGLDALRGLSIAAMILVNNPGQWGSNYQYDQLRHAAWHGCTFTDLVFPTFLFCAGVAIVPALSKKREQGVAPAALLPSILERVLSLVLLGMLLSAFPLITFAEDRELFAPLWRTRFPGVLQRIGVCYGLAAVLFLLTSVRTQRWVLLACLLLYWPLITLLPVPGFGPPDISSALGTLQGYVDRAVFGSHIYVKGQYDPEGLLSTIPALATCLIGVEVGRFVRREQDQERKVLRLLAAAVGMLLLGGLWSLLLPFNKYLWTSSYTVWTGGIATLTLSACIWAFEGKRGEAKHWQRLAYPLHVYGINALLVFVGSGIVGRCIGSLLTVDVAGKAMSWKTWFFQTVLMPIGDAKLASLAFAVLWIVLWFLLLRVLYQRNWIWKV